MQYGVHFTDSKVTLFAGSSYVPDDTNNRDFTVNASDSTLSVNLTGGGSDVIFQKLSGETVDDGTVTLSSTLRTKTVTIYKTGLIEIQ